MLYVKFIERVGVIMKQKHWIKTDELNEAILALDILSEHLVKVVDDTYYWKWSIISIHNSLQGFMVCALRGHNGVNVLNNHSFEEWIKRHENGNGNYVVDTLDDFLNLYKKIKSDKMLMFGNSNKFSPEKHQDLSIEKIDKLRNEFIHFTPNGWSLEVSEVPQIIEDCVDIIQFLTFKSNNIVYPNESIKQKIETLIENIKTSLLDIKRNYDS